MPHSREHTEVTKMPLLSHPASPWAGLGGWNAKLAQTYWISYRDTQWQHLKQNNSANLRKSNRKLRKRCIPRGLGNTVIDRCFADFWGIFGYFSCFQPGEIKSFWVFLALVNTCWLLELFSTNISKSFGLWDLYKDKTSLLVTTLVTYGYSKTEAWRDKSPNMPTNKGKKKSLRSLIQSPSSFRRRILLSVSCASQAPVSTSVK